VSWCRLSSHFAKEISSSFQSIFVFEIPFLS
jgi:hypothetical protein